MRIAALSDIHGNLDALQAVLADIARRGCDLVVNLGDLVSGPLRAAETAALLMARGFPTVRGNHERQLLETPPERMGTSDALARAQLSEAQLRWLGGLPPLLRIEDVLLCHGTPGDDTGYFLEHVDAGGLRAATPAEAAARAGDSDARLLLCGHTHRPRALRLDDGRLVVNPGSVGLPAYRARRPVPHRIETGTPHARYALLQRRGHGWEAELVAVDYDFRAMARLADDHGCGDWSMALRTGRVA
ncbi:MAG TPA: metallophosphoesterase family protein [Pseudoxanthomonas sp.]|nr:metallophosphoesterase family protein [Pseudoxanthomonas sp.]